MVTQLYPLNKANEMADKYLQVIKAPVPSYIKKWQTFTTFEGECAKVYNLIMVEKGNADEATIYITKTLTTFSDIEGYSVKYEVVMGARDSFKAIGRTL